MMKIGAINKGSSSVEVILIVEEGNEVSEYTIENIFQPIELLDILQFKNGVPDLSVLNNIAIDLDDIMDIHTILQCVKQLPELGSIRRALASIYPGSDKRLKDNAVRIVQEEMMNYNLVYDDVYEFVEENQDMLLEYSDTQIESIDKI